MLDKTKFYPLPARLSNDPAVIDAHAYNKLTKSQKAALGASILQGNLTLKPTIKVVAAALQVCPTYLERALKLDRFELRDLHAGRRTLQELTAPSARERFLAAARELGTDTALDLLSTAEAA